jgi:hypothetical protein
MVPSDLILLALHPGTTSSPWGAAPGDLASNGQISQLGWNVTSNISGLGEPLTALDQR